MNSPTFVKQASRITVAAVLGLSAIFWNNPVAAQSNTYKDTLPQHDKKVKDLDDAMLQLQKAKAEVEKAIKETDWNKMEKELQASMQKMEVDMTKMKADMEKAVKEIDSEKIRQEVEKAMKELKEVDAAKIKADVEASLAQIDWEKIKKDMEKVKEVDLAKIKTNLEKIKPEIEKSIQDAKKSIEKAEGEIQEYKTFVDNLEKDGLINKKEGYTIETKEGRLIINGSEQPAAVTRKYQAFLQKHPNITIKKTDDDFDVKKN